MKKLLFILWTLLTSCLSFAEQELMLESGQALQNFVVADQKKTLLTYDAMTAIFFDSSMHYNKLVRAIRSDISRCKRFIKKQAQGAAVEYSLLLGQLTSFYRYVKSNKTSCKAIHFHDELKRRYAFAFNNSTIAQTVETTPHLYGIAQDCKYKYRAYFNRIAADLYQVSRFEDRIHGDHGILKAHNYVYKIELIKVRNQIYHDINYQFETRYF